jgi:hypothetical protein
MASRGHSEPHLAAAAAAENALQRQASGSAAAAAVAAGDEPGDSGSSSSNVDVDSEELRRREVLSKLQGPDTQLESGLKVWQFEGQLRDPKEGWIEGLCLS